MARFRLKFLLQEFDLVGPEVILGRSPECHVTIEDPLVSRQHARILIGGDDAQVVDLGSRNGTRVNGDRIEGSQHLYDGDRIRLGTQELLFFVVQRVARDAKTTGFMTVCRGCGTPYPDSAAECPHCGTPTTDADETFSGISVEPSRSWTFQLLGEVVERALQAGRPDEAERMFKRVAREVESHLEQGQVLSADHIESVSGYAIELAKVQDSYEWTDWALNVHRQTRLIPSNELGARFKATANPASLRAFADWADAEPLNPEERERTAALRG